MFILQIAGVLGLIGALIGFFDPDRMGFKSRREAVHTGIFALALLAIVALNSGAELDNRSSEPVAELETPE